MEQEIDIVLKSFYTVDDVTEILNCSQARAYQTIR